MLLLLFLQGVNTICHYLNYRIGHDMLYIRIIDGCVESYGRLGDFDSTKVPETTLNLKIDSSIK